MPRTAKSKTPEPSRTNPKASAIEGAKGEVYDLYVELLRIRPKIWRRLAVPPDMTLEALHHTLQTAMGWLDGHLHQFIDCNETRYSVPSPWGSDDWEESGSVDASTVTVGQMLKAPGDRLMYEYDFGDGWEHGIELKKVVARESGRKYPCCLAGKRACPPEDCGGVWGYGDLLEALANPKHPEHKGLKEWLGRPFDPEAFDLDEANKVLSRRTRSR